jgi:hypothetical protein
MDADHWPVDDFIARVEILVRGFGTKYFEWRSCALGKDDNGSLLILPAAKDLLALESR